MNRSLLLSSFVALLLLVGCEAYPPPARNGGADSLRSDKLIPDTRLIEAEISLYTRQFTTAKIYADTLVRFDRIDSTMGYVVTTRLLDTTGKVTTTIVGDSAVIRERSQRLQVYGHAVVTSGDTMKVESEYLEWDPVTEQLLTDKFVRIHRHSDIISGIGMTADRKLGRIRLKKQVSGSVENIDVLPLGDEADVSPPVDSFSPERLQRVLDSAADSSQLVVPDSHR